jgi:hypothetical protein
MASVTPSVPRPRTSMQNADTLPLLISTSSAT